MRLFTKTIFSTFLATIFFSIADCKAQSVFNIDTGIQVTENSNLLSNAFSGGLDSPVYSTIDLNHDGVKDIFIFDHKTNRVLTFLNNNIPNTASYQYAPEYEKYFPRMRDWALLYDYDCDGYEDIFTYGGTGIAVYHNMKLSPPQFSLATNQINTFYKGFPNPIASNIWVNSVSLPSLSDIDNDGDMDIISLSISGNYFEYHKNYSMDSTGLCGGFLFYNIRVCWGYFTFGALNNYANLPPAAAIACPPYPASFPRSAGANDTVENKVLHGGVGAICAIDMEGDGDKGLLIGTDYGTNLLYVENGGTPDSAYAISQDTIFPSYDTSAYMNSMPAAFVLDVDTDGKKDMLVANFEIGGEGENYFNTLYYKNTASLPNDHHFQYIKNNFFTEDMIDVGTGAHPAFFDVDGDGLKDLLIASDLFYYGPNVKKAQISYYRNIGSSFIPKYDLITKDFAGISAYHWKGIHPTFGDLDGDGDKDMILGNDSAWLAYFENTGGTGPANFTLITTQYQNISVGSNGQQSTPQLFDLDKDGKLDLVIGRRSGSLYYYHNTGTINNPVFTFETVNLGGVNVFNPMIGVGYSVPLLFDSAGITQLLVGSSTGTLYHYSNIDGNISGQFTLLDSAFKDIYEPTRAIPTMSDINGDGLYDLIIGNLAGGVRCYKQAIIIGLSEISRIDPGFIFYPNPANEILNLEFNETSYSGNREINLYNVLGEKVMQLNTKQKSAVIQLQNLAAGSYIISVIHNGKTISQKFIKK